MTEISSIMAAKALEAGVKKASNLNSPSSIAIIDSGRNLIAFMRMDGALLASIEISQGKAFTARSLNMNSGDVYPHAQPGGAFFGVENSHSRPLVVFGGGIPITIDGSIVGAVGVAGGTIDDDIAIANEVATALGS